jgi:large subunit ribosomal protein L25
LPSGSTLLSDPEQLIVNVTHAPTAAEVSAELDSAEADAGIEHDAPQTEEPASEGAEGDEA